MTTWLSPCENRESAHIANGPLVTMLKDNLAMRYNFREQSLSIGGEGMEATEEKALKILYTSETYKRFWSPNFGEAKYYDSPVIQIECKF